MNYKQTLDYLYFKLPIFQNQGSKAINFKLDNIRNICSELGQPQNKFKSIHIAGTNGKGSTSHILAAILMEQGYKVGLYTSPHLKSFTERIKINGNQVSEQEVIDFVKRVNPLIEKYKPSFFEVTVAMAFWSFANQEIDIAVIEVGMGGRLDSTNIIDPLLSVITNISLDHQQYLGDTIEKIAFEKGGIIKDYTPVVIGEVQNQSFSTFRSIALSKNSELKTVLYNRTWLNLLKTNSYQDKNIETALKAVEVLIDLGYVFSEEKLLNAVTNFKSIAGLKGRWQILQHEPKMICDTGHNVAGVKELVVLLNKEHFVKLHFVLGMVQEKDVDAVLSLLPKNAKYYFCKADNPRSMDATSLSDKAKEVGLQGEVCGSVESAIKKASLLASKDDLIFIGGSTFVVAEIPFL